MGAAYLSIIVLTVYYFLAFQPRRNPYLPRHIFSTPVDDIAGDSTPVVQHQTSTGEPSTQGGAILRTTEADRDYATPSGEVVEEGHWVVNPIDAFILENKVALRLLPRPKSHSETDELHMKVEKAFRKVGGIRCSLAR